VNYVGGVQEIESAEYVVKDRYNMIFSETRWLHLCEDFAKILWLKIHDYKQIGELLGFGYYYVYQFGCKDVPIDLA